MSSLLTSQGMAFATAMAVSGTVILFAFCRQRPFPLAGFVVDPDSSSAAADAARSLRSCIASGERKLRKQKKKKVHFADRLVESVELVAYEDESSEEDEAGVVFEPHVSEDRQLGRGRIPANRIALYNGILQDRLQRMACSY